MSVVSEGSLPSPTVGVDGSSIPDAERKAWSLVEGFSWDDFSGAVLRRSPAFGIIIYTLNSSSYTPLNQSLNIELNQLNWKHRYTQKCDSCRA